MMNDKKYPDIEEEAIAYVEELHNKAKAYDDIKALAENGEELFSDEVYTLLGLYDKADELRSKFWEDIP